ncbi:MAG: exodeoxyribonuclease III [Dehalococcoidales bacterium]|nr:exodeoxyribonuclease III [Dehalococcoidales bacterium]
MAEIKILSWNVNGIRAAARKGFLEWLDKESPDILCLQETKASPEALDSDLLSPPGYQVYWNYPERKGYSGVATFTKVKPLNVRNGFGIPAFDTEGRAIVSEYPEFTLLNVYFPNGKQNDERLKYKLDFYEAFLDFIEALRRAGKNIIFCGDVNTAHKEIDLARPKENEKISGFLPIERAWLDKLVDSGYIDIFRHLHKEPGQYSWWDMKSRARERNVGWRIDYFFITKNLLGRVTDAYILPEVMGSDHCPVGLKLKF